MKKIVNILSLAIFILVFNFSLYAAVIDKTGIPENLNDVKAFINISDKALNRLYNDGIVVLGNNQHYSLSDFSNYDSGGYGYQFEIKDMQGYAPFSIEWYPECGGVYYVAKPLMQNVSVVVTADACLWLFHLIFDDMLKMTEIIYLDDDLKDFASELSKETLKLYDSATSATHPKVIEAYKQLAIFALTTEKLLFPQATIPQTFYNDVITLVGLIENPPNDFHCYPTEYDWASFKPRGHYSGDEQLERYFRAVKWISMRVWQINVIHEDYPQFQRHDIESIAAAWLSKLIIENQILNQKWSRIYDVTSTLAGTADSITPKLAYQAFENVLGKNFNPNLLADPLALQASINEFEKEIYPESRIGLDCCFNDNMGHICGYPKKYFQVMGERFLIDAELFQKIGDDPDYLFTPKQEVIHALDIAAGVLGSKNAETILKEMNANELYKHTIPFLNNLNNTMKEEDWTSKSLYNNWLYSLSGLVKDIPVNSNAPEFVYTRAYGDKQVMTALASWSQLRRDFILYSKPSSSGTICLGGYGIVEPCPDLYLRLAKACEFVEKCFSHYNIILNGVPNPMSLNYNTRRSAITMNLSTAMKDLKEQLYEFKKYADKEMKGEALTCDEQNKIHLFGAWLFNQYFYNIWEKLPTQIADVHTDNLSGILEEAVGWFNPALYLYKQPNGPSLIGVGFVMSHYEFWTGAYNFKRLNDDEWLQMIGNPKDVAGVKRAGWHGSFVDASNVESFPSPNDLCSKPETVYSLPYSSSSTNLYFNTPTITIDPNAPDAWWQLISPPVNTPIDIIAQGGSGPVELAVYKGDCSSLALIESAVPFDKTYQTRLSFRTLGDTGNYYIRAASVLMNGVYNTRNIELSIKQAVESVNNKCENAKIINKLPMIDISTTLINNTADRPYSNKDENPFWQDAFWVLPQTSECSFVKISTKDSRVPASIFVYEGTCDDLTLVKYLNYSGSNPRDGITLFLDGLSAMSKQHYIVVSGDEGEIVLSVSLLPTVEIIANDIIGKLESDMDLDTNQDGKIDIADIIIIINQQ